MTYFLEGLAEIWSETFSQPLTGGQAIFLLVLWYFMTRNDK